MKGVSFAKLMHSIDRELLLNNKMFLKLIQSTLVISNSFISNNRLSRSDFIWLVVFGLTAL